MFVEAGCFFLYQKKLYVGTCATVSFFLCNHVSMAPCFVSVHHYSQPGAPIILVSCLILLLRSGSAYCRASGHRNEDKWWLPVPYVPDAGLTEKVPRDRQQKRDCAANQVPPSPLTLASSATWRCMSPSWPCSQSYKGIPMEQYSNLLQAQSHLLESYDY